MASCVRGRSALHLVALSLLTVVALAATLTSCGPSSQTGGTHKTPTPTSPQAPTLHEFPLPSSDYAPQAITTGVDGALWFTEVLTSAPGGKIGRITTGGAMTEYPLPRPGAYATDIIKGPDGNGIVWFIENNLNGPNFIARVTSGGNITEVCQLAAGAMALRLTAGPDGALWFTVLETNGATATGKIGRITTTGAVTYFQLPDHTSLLKDITTGPDGALWFTEMSQSGGSAHIGRITTAGIISEYPLPSPTYFSASAISSGPGNTLWYVETGGPKGTADKLVRMTTTGAGTEFTLGGSNTAIGGLTTGADGALWFGVWSGEGRLGRITSAGQITYVTSITAGNAVGDITVGPDGKVWFTEAHATGPSPANGKLGTYG